LSYETAANHASNDKGSSSFYNQDEWLQEIGNAKPKTSEKQSAASRSKIGLGEAKKERLQRCRCPPEC